MRTLLLLVLALLLSGCADDGSGEHRSHSDGGAAGSAAALAGDGGADVDVADVQGGPLGDPDAFERWCREFLDYQDAGGFWCSLDGVSVVETGTTNGCLTCYLATCAPDGFTRWVPVECTGLGQ